MRYIFVLICWVLTYGAHAQTYPVQVTTTLIPPYSPVLSYYTAADANNLQVIIHVMELDRRDLRAKLRVTIEGAGVRLYTSPAYVPPALVLQGGVPEMLSGFDIRGYLNPNNLIFEGITRAEFIKSGKLPEGFYTFTIEVLEYNRSVRISNQSRANAWVVLNDPPLINFPFSGDKLRTTDPQNISFSWVGRHLASPNSAFSTEYEFTLYELYPGQTNPEVAVRSSNSIYRTTTTQSSLYYGPAEPQLIPGKKYAYRIRAYDVSGRDLFKNQGYSETNWFQYGDACLPLRSVTAEALDPYRIRISWEPEATHTGFVVSYREAETDRWWTETTYSTSLVIPDLKKGTSYEYQVMGQCNQYEGETSTIQTISTEAEETEDPNFACGTDLIMPELSPNPLQKPLLPLDMFHIGGLDVVVHTVTLNADGSYSGMGHAPMPIFNGAGMRVKIRNVIINEDYYAIAGSVVTVYDTEGRFIVGNTDDLKGDLSEEDAAEDTTTTDAPDDNLLAVEGDIGHVEVIAGELVVTDAEGNPIDIGTVELPAEGETLTLEDASGDTWVVDSEGNVTPGAGNGGTDPNTPGAVGSDVELDYIVTFSPSENQTYGFDEKTQSTLSGYNQTQLNGENHWIAWKSVESGHTDQVLVSTEDQDEFPDYIGFKTPTGTIPSQPGRDKNTRELTLSGILAGNPTTLTAYATQEDEEGNATEVTLGRLDVVAYDMERQKVVIVPVNDAQTPDASALYESLNKIYAQAVAHWEVVVDHAYSVEPEVLQTLDEGESGLLSSFPKNMKQFQQDFKKSRDLDKDAYYLFLIPGSGARAGFMPFKRQYGYIWTGATSDVPRTIAHELAHGAFRLRHTFSPEAFIATQGSTNNLMDYSSGATHLYKHQWDNVHNPESVTSWLQDDEEVAMVEDVAAMKEEFMSKPHWHRAALVLEKFLDDKGFYDEVTIDCSGSECKVRASVEIAENATIEQEATFHSGMTEQELMGILRNTYKVPYFEAEAAFTEGISEAFWNYMRIQDAKIARKEGWVVAYAEFTADLVTAPTAYPSVYGWITGKHWRTGTELEWWEQVLGVIDVIPGEALAKAGITALVIKIGNKVFDFTKVATATKNLLVGARQAGLKVVMKGTNEVILYGSQGIKQIGRFANGVLQDIYWVYGGEKVLARLAGVRYVVDQGTVNGTLEIVEKAGKTAIQKTISTIDDFWARIPDVYLPGVKVGFPNGQATLKYSDGEMIFYRRWGEGAEKTGKWLSPTKYEKPGNAKRYLALPNNNSAENLTAFKIEKGTPYIEGKVASQIDDLETFGSYAEGGGTQIYILHEDLDKLIEL